MRVDEQTAAPGRPLWRNRDYLLLWSGQMVSSVGSGVSTLAFPLLVLALTGSPAQAGFVAALRALPYFVLTLPAGALIDRWDRKRTMILCDTGRALSLGSIPVALALGHLMMAQVYLVAAIEGTLAAFFDLAEVAALTRVVSRAQLPTAVAQNEVTYSITSLLGPPLSGALYSLRRSLPFIADAISYAISVTSLLLIRTPLQSTHRLPAQPEERRQRKAGKSLHHRGHLPELPRILALPLRSSTSSAVQSPTSSKQEPVPRQLRAEISAGLVWLWRQPLLRYLLVTSGGINLVVASSSLIVIVLARRQHASPALIGVIFAFGGAGNVLGTVLSAPLRRRLRFGPIIIGLFWLVALLWPLYAVAPNVWALGAVTAGIALLDSVYAVVAPSYRLMLIPDALQGRVNSIFRLAIYGLLALGQALTGVLIQRLGVIAAVLVFWACLVTLAVTTTLNRPMRGAGMLRQSGEI
jgi:MFS family permease